MRNHFLILLAKTIYLHKQITRRNAGVSLYTIYAFFPLHRFKTVTFETGLIKAVIEG